MSTTQREPITVEFYAGNLFCGLSAAQMHGLNVERTTANYMRLVEAALPEFAITWDTHQGEGPAMRVYVEGDAPNDAICYAVEYASETVFNQGDFWEVEGQNRRTSVMYMLVRLIHSGDPQGHSNIPAVQPVTVRDFVSYSVCDTMIACCSDFRSLQDQAMTLIARSVDEFHRLDRIGEDVTNWEWPEYVIIRLPHEER